MLVRSILIILCFSAGAAGQTLALRNCGQVTDPSVIGLSGMTRVGGDIYWAVMDNSDRVVQFEVKLDARSSIASVRQLATVRLA